MLLKGRMPPRYFLRERGCIHSYMVLADKPLSQLTAQQQKNLVWKGQLKKTASGHGKDKLTLSAAGKVVWKSRQKQGNKAMAALEKSGKKAAPFTGK